MSEEGSVVALVNNLPIVPEAMSMQIEMRSDAGNMPITKAYIRDIIADHDPVLAQVWDELESIGNTNDLVKYNLQQAQIHLQQEQARYYGLEARIREHLHKIAACGPEEAKLLMSERAIAQKEAAKSREYMLKLMATTTAMAKEYRQCMMQQKHIFHMVQLQQFLIGLKASLHRNVRDVDALNAISEDMSRMASSCFSIKEEY